MKLRYMGNHRETQMGLRRELKRGAIYNMHIDAIKARRWFSFWKLSVVGIRVWCSTIHCRYLGIEEVYNDWRKI